MESKTGFNKTSKVSDIIKSIGLDKFAKAISEKEDVNYFNSTIKGL